MNNVKSTIFQIIKRKESLLFLVLFISGLSLLGWILGIVILASISPAYIPIAPSSAIVFIILSSSLFLKNKIQKSPIIQSFNIALVVLVVLFCLNILLDYLFIFNWDIENIFIKNTNTLGNISIGRMSPITALLFVFICVGLLLNRINFANAIKYIGSGFTLMTCIISSVLLIGYLYKAPLLYGSKIIPVALPTAICFLLFSITLLRIYEMRFWTYNFLKDNKVSNQLLKWFLTVGIFIIVFQGYLITNFSVFINSPTLFVALALFIVIPITIFLVFKVSSIIGIKLLKAEQTLNESVREFRSLAESMPQIVWTTRADGWNTYFNQQWVDYTGLTLEESYGHGWNKPFHPDDQQRAWEAWQNAVENHAEYLIDCRLRCHDGTYRWWLIRGIPQIGDKGEIVKWFGTCTDIEKIKIVELALKKSESSLQESQKLAKMGSWTLNISEQTTEWSENSFVQFGYKPFDFEPTLEHIKNRVHPDDWHIVEEGLDFIFKNKVSITSEIRVILPDGTIKWFQNNVVPILQDDELVKIHGINIDITERKIAELELQKSERNIRSIMENSADAIFLANQEGKYIYTNKEVSALLGYTSDEMKKKTIADITNPNKREEIFKIFNQVLNEGKSFTEIELLHKEGNYISTDLNAVLLPDGTLYGSCRDITERKQAEKMLQENDRSLRLLNADKDRFISILGHDLKSPFNNILGFCEILTDEIDSLNKDKIKDIVNNIHESAQITYKLLEEILMWASAQNGNIPFNPQILSFTTICKNVVDVLKPNADEKNITINYSASDHLKVFADNDMLRTVIRNLVSNSIKFTNSGGKINVSAEQTDSGITISVSDNGIGIPPENQAKLLDISKVFTTKGTANETGTGLGLLLCKEFVEKHGGKIWVESEVDKGSTFRFTLPKNHYPFHNNILECS